MAGDDQHDLDSETPTERTALLSTAAAATTVTAPSARATDNNGTPGGASQSNGGVDEEDEDVPLPKLQLFLLSYANLVAPLVFFSIFPFVNQMIAEVGSVKEKDVGLYSGWIESLFSFVQIFAMPVWGRMADKFGRKPVLLISLVGVGVTGALFGLATSVWEMFLYRCLAGVFGGTVVTIRTLFSLNSTPRTEARAFSFFAFSGNLSIFLGPFVGGLLSQPATQYPNSWLAKIAIFKSYPYFLPTLVTGVYALSAFVICAIGLKEPERVKKTVKKPASGDGVQNGAAEEGTAQEEEEEAKPPTFREILTTPGVPMGLTVYGLCSMLGIGYTAIAPLWWFTPNKLGGLGLTPPQISIMLGTIGFSQAFWMLLIFPPVQKRLGTIGLLRACSVAWPTGFTIMPGLALVKRFADSQGKDWVFWSVAVPMMMLSAGISMAFTGSQLLINALSPSPHALGTLNGIALSLQSALRAFGPVLFSVIFAVGVRERILWGELIWVPLVALGLVLRATLMERWIPEKVKKRDESVVHPSGHAAAAANGGEAREN